MADFDINDLITDRGQSDVNALRSALSRMVVGRATSADYALVLNPANKGSYNTTDLNRVGSAILYLRERLYNECGLVVAASPKTDWIEADIPTLGEMQTYLANISSVRSALTLPDGAPLVPADMDGLGYAEANDIERILQIVDGMIDTIKQSWRCAGELYAGEV